MNVAWGLRWRESQSTKPCVFPCKVAAAGNERYLVCAAVAGAIVSMSAYFFALVDFLVADRSVMAARVLRGAAAACGILGPFSRRHRKSY